MHRSITTISILIVSVTLSISSPQKVFAGETDRPPLAAPRQEVIQVEPGHKGSPQQIYPSPELAASHALEILKSPEFFRMETGGEERARNLGFESAAEVADVTFGKPLQLKQVGLNQLKEFRPKDDPNSLLIDSHTIIFPLYVKGKIRSSLTVSDIGNRNTWRQTERGIPLLIRTIEDLRKKFPETDEPFLVTNQGISVRFLGNGTGDNFMLIPLDTYTFETVALPAGQVLPARKVFAALAAVAAKRLAQPSFRKGTSQEEFQSHIVH